MRDATEVTEKLTEEDGLRAQFYGLLARFLTAPPSDEFLASVARLDGDDTPLGQAVSRLARVCSRCDAATADGEYHELFIGVGRGELLPFASYYLAGFLHEKPLAKLKADMARVGVARRDGVSEPEDHAASVLETMAGLIDGRFGAPKPLHVQKEFYDANIASWMPVLFQDLETASASELYASLAEVGLRFLDIEAAGFEFDQPKAGRGS